MNLDEVKAKLNQTHHRWDEVSGGGKLRIYLENGNYDTISISEFGHVILNGKIKEDEDFERWLSL